MSKAQLVTALRRSFGNDMITSEASIGKLFDSFDFYGADTMDWRAFLYLLTILMQPSSQCDVLLRWVASSVDMYLLCIVLIITFER